MTAWQGGLPAIDASRPGIARVYDCLLGGKDNFAVDREQVARLTDVVPGLARLARENRQFIARAVFWLATQGIRQFIDLGCGLPTTSPSVHQCARLARPGARVVYVDNDPVVTGHARARLAGDGAVAVVRADIRHSAAILARPELRKVIDAGQPAGVVAGMVMHFFSPQEAQRICAELSGALAPGSYLVISVGTGDAATWEALAELYEAAPVHRHRAGQVAGLFGGLELVPPGVVHAEGWVPGPAGAAPELDGACVLVGVGRVPGR
jgi:SAM-dependent methyltransferase